MRVGFVGLGKLGLPVALSVEAAGHEVIGTEISLERRLAILRRRVPEMHHEPQMTELLATSNIRLMDLAGLVQADPDVIFVCVQTPHQAEFEGCTPLLAEPRDFDYSYLSDALTALADAGATCLVNIVSTCLPGTIRGLRRSIGPSLGRLRVSYNPLFIAMGSVIPDFENPEFVLIGTETGGEPIELTDIYRTVAKGAPLAVMSITSAEATKVFYNAAIGFKLMLANTVAEVCDELGGNADSVNQTLAMATKRIVSTAYMDAGMGDGGGCHPRDQIAMSAMAKRIGLSHDPFQSVIRGREAHAKWLAGRWLEYRRGLPLVMLGEAYKRNTNLATGSPARLVAWYVREAGVTPVVLDSEAEVQAFITKACFFIATPHDWVVRFKPPEGSVVVDPWGLFPTWGGTLIRPGRSG